MKRILWINPAGTSAFDKPIGDILGDISHDNTYIEVVSLPSESRPQHLEFHSYEAIVEVDIVKIVHGLNKNFDCIVIGCFYDTGLRAAREVSGECVVTAPCISCCKQAVELGNKFSVIVGHKKWIPKMKETVLKYGYEKQLVSFRSMNLGVHEFQKDHQETKRRMIEASKKAIEEDGAEVIILGCTIEFGFYEQLQKELGVPVIDAVVAPFKNAELLAESKIRFGWKPSRNFGNAAPRENEVKQWKLFDDFEKSIGNKYVVQKKKK